MHRDSEVRQELRKRLTLTLDPTTARALEDLKAQFQNKNSAEVIRRALSMLHDSEGRKSKEFKLVSGEGYRNNELDISGLVERTPQLTEKSGGRVDLQSRLSEVQDKQVITAEERAQLSNLSLLTTSLVIPERRLVQGSLVRANTLIWEAIVDTLRADWSQAYVIPPEKFEELIAGAFERAGYDDVILTPRSSDHGRDVIALKRGVGCVKIIGSVKRYAAHRPVRYDDVRALMGVLSSESDSSKGMVITTSSFPDDLPVKDEFSRFIPTRLELMDGKRTLDWLSRLRLN